jgi:hypothetical protein
MKCVVGILMATVMLISVPGEYKDVRRARPHGAQR